jgi:hypothetical protein
MPELTSESIFPDSSWEEHAAFRSTFLMHFTKEGDRAALEILGQLLYEMVLDVNGVWPHWPESPIRVEMRAVAADLRHAQAFLAAIAEARHTSSLKGEDERLSLLADGYSREVGQTAKGLESALGPAPPRVFDPE